MSELPIVQLDSIDSTNNYAMQLIDADKAQHGLTIVAQNQTGGKGQRGKTWIDAPGQCILMSIISKPERAIGEQFAFNASVAVAIVKVLQYLYEYWDIKIKWPNDIIINDKKAGGVLIENVLRGSHWTYSVIGLGLNVSQEEFPETLPHATSLKIASGNTFELDNLGLNIRDSILTETGISRSSESTMDLYNEYLYKKNAKQSFSDNNGQWDATILNVQADGSIQVKLDDGTIAFYNHGQVLWDWTRT